MKYNPLPEMLRGKRVIVVDDTIVRGTTTTPVVAMLRRAGATRGAHAHHLAADPASVLLRRRHGDAGGDDRPQPAHEAEVAAEWGATRWRTVSLAGVYEAIQGVAVDPLRRVLLGGVPVGAERERRSARTRSRLTLPLVDEATGVAELGSARRTSTALGGGVGVRLRAVRASVGGGYSHVCLLVSGHT